MSGKIVEFKPHRVVTVNDQRGHYEFTENAPAKSSTNVAVGGTVCRTCGCPKGPNTIPRADCKCACHPREDK